MSVNYLLTILYFLSHVILIGPLVRALETISFVEKNREEIK